MSDSQSPEGACDSAALNSTRNSRTTLAAILLLAGLATFLFHVPAVAAENITGSGCSVSVVGYLTDLAKEYERHAGIKVLVRGGGAAVGIDDLRNGTVDFAASCRPREADDPPDIQFVQVAWDALVVIVHPSNPVDSIKPQEIRDVYDHKIMNWSQLRGKDMPIKLFISRAKKGLSGVEASTRALILKGKEPTDGPGVLFLASTGIVEQMVENTPEAFAVTGFTSAQRRSVKMLKVNLVRPTTQNIISGTYPFRRPLFILLPENPKPEVKKFLEFVLSAEGQRFIRSRNIVALHDVK
jgi:phosphate transport system substrate-binding protein